jgi:hypothetical protein
MRLATIEHEGGGAMQPRNGRDSVIAIALSVLALGLIAEAVWGRTATPPPGPVSSWAVVLRAADEARARGDVPAARRAYLTALFRARGERSLPGVLSAAEGFKALGDREVVERALEMAAALEPEAGTPLSRRLQALRERLAAAEAVAPEVPFTR